MKIYEIMQITAKDYGARHTGFDQYWKKPSLSKENQGGVCAALVFGWLKSSHKHGYLSNATLGLIHSDDRIKHIGQRQTALSNAKYDQGFTDKFISGNRTGEGFGALSLTRVGEPYVATATLAGIQGYDLIPNTANILWNTYLQCGATMTLGCETMKENHVVGTFKTKQEFMFFDPNGGLMSFKDPGPVPCLVHAGILQGR